MSLQVRIESLVQRLASVFKTVDTQMGRLEALSTTDKSSLVAAINEVRLQLAQIGGGGSEGGEVGHSTPLIVDNQPQATDTTFSAAKIMGLLEALKTELLGGSDSAFDTFRELQLAIEQDQTGLRALLVALDARVRVDSEQSLTQQQQALARRNIGAQEASAVGDTETDFVAVFEMALGSSSSQADSGNDSVGGAGAGAGAGHTAGEPVLS